MTRFTSGLPHALRRPTRAGFLAGGLLAAGIVVAGCQSQPAPGPDSAEALRERIRTEVQQVTLEAAGQTQAAAVLPTPQIVGGQQAGAEDNPFQVALLLKTPTGSKTNRQAAFCGGSLVSATKVVTAAHCSTGINPRGVSVLSGTRTLDSGGKLHRVDSIRIHPDYNARTLDYDVAVWTLASPAATVPKAQLAEQPVTNGTTMKTTGWGATSQGGATTNKLQVVEVPKVAKAECNKPTSYNGEVTDRMLCAGYASGGKDACQGDSGGPLTAGPNDRTLYGVTSWGFGCARPNLYGVYARVADPAIRSFLTRQLAR
jgi:secreted trypsin-like serine protease